MYARSVCMTIPAYVRTSLSCRVQETDDLKDTDKAELEAIAGDIEDNLFTIHKDVNHKYKARYRSLLFNLKDEKNKALFRRVVSKTISSDQLVVMSHDQLASDELSRWREEELKKVHVCMFTGHRSGVCTVLVLFACVSTFFMCWYNLHVWVLLVRT